MFFDGEEKIFGINGISAMREWLFCFRFVIIGGICKIIMSKRDFRLSLGSEEAPIDSRRKHVRY